MFSYFSVVKLIDKAEVNGDHRQQNDETKGITFNSFTNVEVIAFLRLHYQLLLVNELQFIMSLRQIID